MQSVNMAKEDSYKLRLDEADRARLDALAEHYAISVAAVVRMLVKRDFDALALKPARKKR